MSALDGSDWPTLFRIAVGIIDQANSCGQVVDRWSFGGGTALMLQIRHRVSHDIDIFIDDPQVLPLLNPETQEYGCEIAPSGYETDGSHALKISFDSVGEIDFIVCAHLTDDPTFRRIVESREIDVETVPEIIAKKIYYRAGTIKVRDIFDIAAASLMHRDEIVETLRPYKAETAKALETINRLNPDFVERNLSDLAVLDEYKPLRANAKDKAADLLAAV